VRSSPFLYARHMGRESPGVVASQQVLRLVGDGEDVRTAALLCTLQHRLEPHLDQIVEDLYDRLALDPTVAVVVARLTADQLLHLKRRQAGHLRMLLSPHLGQAEHEERSREVGRVHARLGVDMGSYAAALTDHRRGVMDAIRRLAPDVDQGLAQTAVGDRFMSDLHSALLGFRDLDEAQNRTLLKVLHEASAARTVADLARGTTSALGALDGIVVVFFARPDDRGNLQYEAGGGPGFPRFVAETLERGHAPIATDDGVANGQGPMGRAWRAGRIEVCDSWSTDPAMRPWRAMAERLGWGSSASLPLVDRRGETRAILNVQASWTGYFSTPARAEMLDQVKQAVEQALTRLEEQAVLGAGVSGIRDRSIHLARLERGDVEMVFQPVVSLASGRLGRLEALARLRAGDRMVPPAEFLPAFGEEELFTLFGVGLRQSLEALRRWEDEGLRTGVSLNLPVVAAGDKRYVDLVADLLETYRMDAHRLTFELLESGTIDAESLDRHHTVEALAALGVRLAQDDLGSGYSSLTRLRHFPFDEVKIDQGLVRGTSLVPGAALHFIEPINDIAQSLGMSVVIEGLEDDGLIEAAVQLGVEEGQGYGIARPMAAADVPQWARSFRLEHDADCPRTALGALAAHVAWERRAALTAGRPDGLVSLGLHGCPMTTYLRLADRAVLDAHRAVHAAALSGRGSLEHRTAWAQLGLLVSG
jgi:EAL domain-containing protein (putative c-di-GMP-specific phosphodiesterase class I)